MDKERATQILGDRATWELRNMSRALNTLSWFNTNEENKRLDAVMTLLIERTKRGA